jgi:hypothetical protein
MKVGLYTGWVSMVTLQFQGLTQAHDSKIRVSVRGRPDDSSLAGLKVGLVDKG